MFLVPRWFCLRLTCGHLRRSLHIQNIFSFTFLVYYTSFKMDEEIDGFGELCDSTNVPERKTNSNKRGGGFQSFGFSYPVLKGLQKRGYKIPTPIQRKSIPFILQGRDVVAMARTGSGKTACFLLPMFEKLSIKTTHKTQFGFRALILSPTRELALQTVKFIKELGKFTKLKAVAILGGDSMDYQFGILHNNPDIVVATPGRFLHLCVEMDLKLNSVEYVVFDEADRLFEMGFGEQLKEILARLGEARQTLLFSATLPKLLIDFTKAGLTNPVLLRLDVESKLPDTLDLSFFCVNHDEKTAALLTILQLIQKESQCLVFAATKHHVEYLHMVLDKASISNTYIYSDLDPSARKINVGKFQNKKCSVLIVTDVAARGVDIPHLDYVINYHFPAKPKLFIHRVGRCARAGRIGTAFSIISSEEVPYVLDLHLFLGRKLNLVQSYSATDGNKTETVLGKIPSFLIETHQCELISWHKNDDELNSMARVCANGYKKYLQSRPGASPESVRRLKELDIKNVWYHPFFHNLDSREAKVLDFVDQIKNYKPKGTVFELNFSNKSKCYRVMKKTKKAHKERISNFNKKVEMDVKENDVENQEVQNILKMENGFEEKESNEANLCKKRKLVEEQIKHTKKKKLINPEYYIPHAASDHHTEMGLAINNFTREANKVAFDLSGDCEEGLKAQKQLKKWDKKRKKMVNIPNDKVGKIKTESGNWISASYKSNKYEQWKEKCKVGNAEENDEEEQSERKSFYSKDFPNTRWGKHNRKIAEKLKAQVKLKRPEQILKERMAKERKRQKSIPRNKRKGFMKKKKQK